jgi:hypothetical protein
MRTTREWTRRPPPRYERDIAQRIRSLLFPLAALLVPLVARGAPPPHAHVALSWTRSDPLCADDAAIAALVETAIGRHVFRGTGAPVGTLVGSIGPAEGGGFEAHIELRGVDGATLATRTLATHGACRELDASVAVVVSVMIDAMPAEQSGSLLDVAPDPLPPDRAPAAAPSTSMSSVFATYEPEAPPTIASSAPPRFTGPRNVSLDLGFGFSNGFVGPMAPLIAARIEDRLVHGLAAAIALRAHASTNVVDTAVGGAVSAQSIEASMCPYLEAEGVHLAICIGAGVGSMSWSPARIDLAPATSSLVYFGTIAPALSFPLYDRLAIRLEGGLLLLPTPPTWSYTTKGGASVQVFAADSVAAFGSLSIEIATGP